MAIIELHLDRPALKRVEAGPETESTEASDFDTGTRWSGEDPEAEESDGGGGGIGRKVLLLAIVGAAVFAVMRWRSSTDEEKAAIDIGTEETRPKTR